MRRCARVHQRLRDAIGAEEAAALMSLLPATELVTKADLQAFAAHMRAEFAEFRGDMRADLRVQVRTLFLSLVGLQVSAAALALAVIRLA